MADPSVNGNVISWPADGWYQVQTSNGATTLCNGGSSCTVEPGSYLVINHTRGIRYTGIQVDEARPTSDIQVDGNVISWPDNGWYQVQTSDGRDSLCNGGSSCTVSPGVYLVINHDTGQRFTNIDVLEDGPGNGEPGIINRDNHVELLDQVFSVYTGSVYESEFTESIGLVMGDNPYTDLVVPSSGGRHTNRDYVCDNGGILNYRVVYIHDSLDFNEYNMHNCQVGSAIFQGQVTQANLDSGGSGYVWVFSTDSSITGDNGVVETTDGYRHPSPTSWWNSNPPNYYDNQEVVAEFSFSRVKGSETVSIEQATTNTSSGWASISPSFYLPSDDGYVPYFDFQTSLGGAFTLRSPLTGGNDLHVATLSKLQSVIPIASESHDYPPLPQGWTFTEGVLELIASDGSSLKLDADSGDEDTARITLLQDDQELESFLQPWTLWNEQLWTLQ